MEDKCGGDGAEAHPLVRRTAMVVGPLVSKFTWLTDTVTVRGRVLDWTGDNVQLGVGADGFLLQVDDNYAHLTSSVGKSGDNGRILHCETYPIDASQTNRPAPWG